MTKIPLKCIDLFLTDLRIRVPRRINALLTHFIHQSISSQSIATLSSIEANLTDDNLMMFFIQTILVQ